MLDAKAKLPRRVSGLKIIVASGRLTIKAGRSSYASIMILHRDVLQVLLVIPQKSRTFSKIFRFSHLIQFCSSFLESSANDLLERLQLDFRGLRYERLWPPSMA